MKLSFLRTTSSQRWALGAVGLVLLFACSPKPEEPAQPTPQPPSLSTETASAPAPAAQPPGYAGTWAFLESECGEATKTFKLSADRIDMTPGERSCNVSSISEDHPTGRSAVYTVKAACLTEGEKSEDTFKLDFGASDTVMQLQLNDREPVRLVRCP